jgi:hypothetical protein
MYNSQTTLSFIRLYYVIIPAAYFGLIVGYTLHLFEDQPEDGRTIGPKHAAGIIT